MVYSTKIIAASAVLMAGATSAANLRSLGSVEAPYSLMVPPVRSLTKKTEETGRECSPGDWISWKPFGSKDGKCRGQQHCCPNIRDDRSKGAKGTCVDMKVFSLKSTCDEVGVAKSIPATTAPTLAPTAAPTKVPTTEAPTEAPSNTSAEGAADVTKAADDKTVSKGRRLTLSASRRLDATTITDAPTAAPSTADAPTADATPADATTADATAADATTADASPESEATALSAEMKKLGFSGEEEQKIMAGLGKIKSGVEGKLADKLADPKVAAEVAQYKAAIATFVAQHKEEITKVITKLSAVIESGKLTAEAVKAALKGFTQENESGNSTDEFVEELKAYATKNPAFAKFQVEVEAFLKAHCDERASLCLLDEISTFIAAHSGELDAAIATNKDKIAAALKQMSDAIQSLNSKAEAAGANGVEGASTSTETAASTSAPAPASPSV